MPDDLGKEQADIWVLTDGKIGDDVQCLAVARAMAGDAFEKRVIVPRQIFAALAPWGPIDPRDRPGEPQSPIAPPFPDVLVASGRRAIPYARAVRHASGGKTKIAIMKDPRFGRGAADVIWAPAHDRLRGANVVSTLTSPHEMSARIDAARAAPSSVIAGLPRPLLGVVLGGPSGGARYDNEALRALSAAIARAAEDYESLAVTPSRRTPAAMFEAVRAGLADKPAFVWDGVGENPYADILSGSDTLIVTADSHNMMSEALAAGVGVYAFRPPGLAPKLAWFVGELEKTGAVRVLDGAAPSFTTTPVDATPEIVGLIRARLSLKP